MDEFLDKKELKHLAIPQMLKRSARRFSDSIALSAWKDEKLHTLTYAELENKVTSFARGLKASGITKNDKVGIVSENRPEWGIAYFGILSAGGIVVPLDPLLKCSEMEALIRDSGMKGLVTSGKFLADLIEIKKKLPGLDFLVCMDEKKENGIFSFSEILEKGKVNKSELPEAVPEDTAVIIYTSGTTGKSKGVMLSHKNIMSDVWGTKEALKLYPEDNFLSLLPLHHTFECTAGLLIPFSGGSRVTYARSLKSKEILEDVKNSGVTIILGVPLLYEKLFTSLSKNIQKKSLFTRASFKLSFGFVKTFKKLSGINLGRAVFKSLREKAELSSLRILICGAAPLPSIIPECFDLLGIKFLQGYGLTETSPVLTLNPYDKLKYSSVGLPIPGDKIPDEEKLRLLMKQEIEKCCEGIADYKRVKHFQIRKEEFEKTSTRKIKRFLFKQI